MLKIRNIAARRATITPAAKYLLMGLAALVLSSFSASKHPYYISLTEISSAGAGEIRVSVRIFTNDMEDALRKSSGKPIDILHPQPKAQADSVLFHYIQQHLSIRLNAKIQSLHYVGYEQEEESTWTYLEIKQPKATAVKTVEVTNSLLYDYFPSQTHIIRVNLAGNNTSRKITNPESTVLFYF